MSYCLFVYVVKFLVEEETALLVVATIAWGLRKCSHVVVLILIFLIAIRPGLIHAIYSKFNGQQFPLCYVYIWLLLINILLIRIYFYLYFLKAKDVGPLNQFL